MRLILAGLAAGLAYAQAEAPALTAEDMESFLRTAKIVDTRLASKGVTGSLRATMTDGKMTHDAHIQSVDMVRNEFKSRRAVELNFKDSYKFNIAAYRLGLLLGIRNIPISIERKVAGKTSAVTWWVDDVMMDESARRAKKVSVPDPDRFNDEMHVVRVFDQLIYNTDRNLQNILITKKWDLRMIDHTRAFRIRKDLQNPANLVKCERTLLAKMRELNLETLIKHLRPYLTKLEIEALLERRDRIVRLFEEKVAAQGEAAVLYDLRAGK